MIGLSPAKMMMARCLRLTFDLLLPDLAAKLQKKQLKHKEGHENRAKLQSFSLEDSVYVRNYSYGLCKMGSC